MANVISRTREHERKDRAAAKRLEREARRLARRVSVPETAWAPPPNQRRRARALLPGVRGQQSASEAEVVR